MVDKRIPILLKGGANDVNRIKTYSPYSKIITKRSKNVEKTNDVKTTAAILRIQQERKS